MSGPVFLELADPASGVHAWAGSGFPGLGKGEVLFLAREGDELLAAGVAPGTVKAEGGSVFAGAALNGVELEAESGLAGDAPAAGTASVKLTSGATKGAMEALAVFTPGPDAGGADLMRTVTAIPESGGSAVTALATRPSGKEHHDEEDLSAWLLPSGSAAKPVFEPLLSTQFDSEGAQSRAGFELWADESDHAPLRVAGLRRLDFEVELADGWVVHAGFFSWRVDGGPAEGTYLLWRRSDG